MSLDVIVLYFTQEKLTMPPQPFQLLQGVYCNVFKH